MISVKFETEFNCQIFDATYDEVSEAFTRKERAMLSVRWILLIWICGYSFSLSAAECVPPTHVFAELFVDRRPPVIAQSYDYNCGAPSLQSWLHTQGVHRSEDELTRIIRATAKDGSLARDYVRGIRKDLGFKAQHRTGLSWKNLGDEIRSGKGVIVNFQSEGVGHWSLVVDCAPDHLVLMDPWYARTHPGQYRTISREEFLPIWYGMDDGAQGAVLISPKVSKSGSQPLPKH